METLKHIDPAVKDIRGEIHNIFEGHIEHVALITSKKGTVRAKDIEGTNNFNGHIKDSPKGYWELFIKKKSGSIFL